MNLFNLFAKITLDDSEYKEKMKDDEKVASSFSSKVGVAFKTAGKVLTGFVTGVAAVGGALAALTVKFVDAGSEIDDTSQKLGISAKSYQYWSLVLQRAGSDASNLSMMIRNMTTFTQELSEGNADALLALQDLGIGYEDFMAMSTEEQLYAIVEALQGMEKQTDKVQIAQKIFGERTYQELLPLLNTEQGSLGDLREEFEGLGLIMSNDTVKSIAAVGDKLDNMGNLIKTAGLIIAADFLPEINNILDAFINLITGSGDVETAMQSVSDGFVGVIEKIANAAPDIINAAGDLIINVLTGIVDVIADPKVINAIVNVAETLLNKLIEILPTLVGSLGDLAKALINAILKVDWGTLILNLLSALIEIATETLPNLLGDLITTCIDFLINLFTTSEGLESIAKFGISLAQGLINGLISGIESGVNLVIKAVNGVLGGISKAWTWAGIPAIPDIPEISIPRVSFFAKGGMFDELMRGTAYAVAGEGSAEIVAQGKHGTGVANVDQIADAQYSAMENYNIKGTIEEAVVAIVNGIVYGLRGGTMQAANKIIIQIGPKELKDVVYKMVDDKGKSLGLKSYKQMGGQ